eukprot:488185-Prymnesium_polylepis.1
MRDNVKRVPITCIRYALLAAAAAMRDHSPGARPRAARLALPRPVRRLQGRAAARHGLRRVRTRLGSISHP